MKMLMWGIVVLIIAAGNLVLFGERGMVVSGLIGVYAVAMIIHGANQRERGEKKLKQEEDWNRGLHLQTVKGRFCHLHLQTTPLRLQAHTRIRPKTLFCTVLYGFL